ncbi:MAG: type VI secretion system protein IglI family protein [Syntrophobacter sp.]
MDLSLLKQPLPVVENPGLETTDPRLEEVSALVQRAQYEEAASVAESILAEGIYDIRMIGFLSYGVFLEQGIGSLKDTFECLAGVFRDNWSAIGPVVKREKHAQTSLRWFFNQLLKKLQYEENAKGELWNRWVSEVTSDETGEVLDAVDGLGKDLGIVLEDAASPLMDALAKLSQWLKAFQQIVYREDEPEAEGETEPESEPMDASEAETGFTPARRDAGDVFQASPDLASSEEGIVIEGSYHLRALMRKMEAFERLIAEEKYPRAALVADDVSELIASFDPRSYFPKFFARFAYLRAAHFQELFAFDDQRETAEWQALKDFYRVDLEGFVES